MAKPKQIGNAFDLAGETKGISTHSAAYVDRKEMSAMALISTPGVDRAKDSVNPLGGNYDNYRKNPIVMWDHGLALTIPIAKSIDRDRNLTVYPTEQGIYAKSYFSNRNLESEQIFNLIDDEIVRATSIRFFPLQAPVQKSGSKRFDRWELHEWSWTPLGVNPEAVAGVLSKGRLAGRQIGGAILKSLSAYIDPETLTKCMTLSKALPPPKKKAPADEAEVETTEPTQGAEQAAPPPGENTKAQNTGGEQRPQDGEQSATQPGAKGPDGQDDPEETGSFEDAANEHKPEEQQVSGEPVYDQGKPEAVPLGAKLLGSVQEAAEIIVASLQDAMRALENPMAKVALDKTISSFDAIGREASAAYKSIYSGVPQSTQTAEMQQFKSMLYRRHGNRLTVSGLAGALRKSSTRSEILEVAQRLDQLVSDARTDWRDAELKSLTIEKITPVTNDTLLKLEALAKQHAQALEVLSKFS